MGAMSATMDHAAIRSASATPAASAVPAAPATPAPPVAELSIDQIGRAIEASLASVVLGKALQVRLVTAAILTGGHVLLHDLPGVGKTTLASAAARSVGGEFRRVQGSPDLMPTDLTGAVVLDQSTGEWRYRPGPLLANVVLVDEINRISPRTQSALLQVMAERRISIEGSVRPLPDPYLVIATMNPTGSAGTFELATGQLDRFDLAVSLGPVDREGERALLRRESGADLAAKLGPVMPTEAWAGIRRTVASVHVADPILDYVLDLCAKVRVSGHVSVRGSRALVALAQALAVLDGRAYVVPDDVRVLAPSVLAHRLLAPGVPLDELTNRVRAATEQVAAPQLSR